MKPLSFSMYEASVPLFTQLLGSLSAVLDKGAAFAAAKRVDPAVLMQQRLVADMLPLVRQVQIATDTAKLATARLAGVDAPSYPDEEKTIDDAKARIQKTIDYLASVPREKLESSAEREVVFTVGPPTARREMRFHGAGYLTSWAIPNFTFHCTTAYNILRENGVEIGKQDFMGAVQHA